MNIGVRVFNSKAYKKCQTDGCMYFYSVKFDTNVHFHQDTRSFTRQLMTKPQMSAIVLTNVGIFFSIFRSIKNFQAPEMSRWKRSNWTRHHLRWVCSCCWINFRNRDKFKRFFRNLTWEIASSFGRKRKAGKAFLLNCESISFDA